MSLAKPLEPSVLSVSLVFLKSTQTTNWLLSITGHIQLLARNLEGDTISTKVELGQVEIGWGSEKLLNPDFESRSRSLSSNLETKIGRNRDYPLLASMLLGHFPQLLRQNYGKN